ncbi:MAG: hypothetical protein KatS3mg109_0163 [Pirellulaceae bacterium]|nr:MAG: hypothetical protein KatS3mg109_0163 [Pirellulaceae bacterium]
MTTFDLARQLELLACCTRDLSLVRDLMSQPDDIKSSYDPLTTMFLSVLSTHDELFGKPPSEEHLKMDLEVQISANEDETTKRTLVGLTKRVFACRDDLEDKTARQISEIGRTLMAAMLKSIRTTQLRLALTDENSDKDISEVVEKARRDLNVISASRANVFDDEWNVTHEELSQDNSSTFMPTFVDFVDAFCDGGIAAGEVVGHSAPIGQGKTTLVLQICWSRIMNLLSGYEVDSMEKLQSIDWSKFPIVYGFFFEKVVNLIPSVVSNAAFIPRDTAIDYYLKKQRDPKILSSKERGDYKPYERQLFRAQFRLWEAGEAPAPDGELERAQRVQFIASKLFRMADFSGASQQLLEWATTGVTGMRNYIEAHQAHVGEPGIDFICCDYVGALADVWKRSSDRMIRNMARNELLKLIVTSMGIDLASPLNCPVWAAHQLNSIENKRGGGFVPDPTNNEGTGMFLERCAVGIASGKLTQEGVSVFVNAKQRRSAERKPVIVQLSKQFAKWEGISRKYSIVGGQIVDESTEVSRAPSRSKRGNFKIPVSTAFDDGAPF